MDEPTREATTDLAVAMAVEARAADPTGDLPDTWFSVAQVALRAQRRLARVPRPDGAPAPVDQIANAIRTRQIQLVDAAGRQAESIHDWLIDNGWTAPS